MVEAANTDGNVTNDEINKVSFTLIEMFKEDPSRSKKNANKNIKI